MIKWVVIFFVIVILILILFYNLVNWVEKKALFYPSKRRNWKPKIPYETIYLNENNKDFCHDKKDRKKNENYVSCWHFNNFKHAKTVIFFHGNSGNIYDRSYIINLCHKFKINLFLVDYYGFGDSSEFPHKLFLRENGETAYNFLHNICNIKSKDIIIWGESLGCLPASYVCCKYKCGGLILLSGFSSLDDLLNYGFHGYKQSLSKISTSLLSLKMDFLEVKDYLQNVQCPVVIIHSKNDTIIPYKCANINYNSIKHKNKLRIWIGGDHSSPKIKTSQLRKVFRFINLPDKNLSSESINCMLKNLETFAKKHNNFMY